MHCPKFGTCHVRGHTCRLLTPYFGSRSRVRSAGTPVAPPSGRRHEMKTQSLATRIDQLLGPVGLFALVAVGQLAGPAYDGSSGKIAGVVARRAIDLLAGVGWL